MYPIWHASLKFLIVSSLLILTVSNASFIELPCPLLKNEEIQQCPYNLNMNLRNKLGAN